MLGKEPEGRLGERGHGGARVAASAVLKPLDEERGRSILSRKAYRTFGLAALALAVTLFAAFSQAVLADGTLGILVKKVDTAPMIDGDPSDPQWASATAIVSSNTSMKAVYTDEEIAILYEVEDPTMTIVAPDSWYFNGEEFIRWREYRQELGDPAYRSWEMYNLVWQTSDFNLEGGCQYMCHTTEEGRTRHLVPEGSAADMWNLMGKHGYGPDYMYETGWPLGYLGAFQEGPIGFVTGDTRDPFQVVSGTFTFIGWADERYQTHMNNPAFEGQALATDTGRYCIQCHDKEFVETNSLQGKPGRMPYRQNGITSPAYIKINPVNFADAAVITELDIKEGRAVRVDSLSAEELRAAWRKYESLNALIPPLVLQEPSESMADVLVAARWSDGIWTVELKRALVTDDPLDVQFDDLTQSYTASTAVSFGVANGRVSGAYGSDVGIEFRFEQ